MSILRRVTRNTGLLALAQVVDKFANFFLIVLLVRHLPAETFGQYGFVTSYVVLFNVMVGLGLAALCTREIARDPDSAGELLTTALVPMLGASILAVALISGSVWLTKGDPILLLAAQLAALELVLSSFTQVFAAVPRAHERMEYTVLPQVARSVFVLLACWWRISQGLSLVDIFVIILAAGTIRLVMQAFVARHTFGVFPRAAFDAARSRDLLREALPLALTSVFVIIYYKIDAVMISYAHGDREVGLYTAAATLAFALFFIAQAFHQATFPALSKLAIEPGDRARKTFSLSMKLLTITGLPLATGLFVLAPRAIVLIYDERYLPATEPFRILTAALFLMFLGGFLGNALIAYDDQRTLMHIVAAAAIMNVLLNLVFIPRFGIRGAAATTVASEIFATTVSWAILRRRYGLSASLQDLGRVGVCSALMGGFTWWFSAWPLVLLIPASAMIYVGLLFVTRTVGANELRLAATLAGPGRAR